MAVVTIGVCSVCWLNYLVVGSEGPGFELTFWFDNAWGRQIGDRDPEL